MLTAGIVTNYCFPVQIVNYAAKKAFKAKTFSFPNAV